MKTARIVTAGSEIKMVCQGQLDLARLATPICPLALGRGNNLAVSFQSLQEFLIKSCDLSRVRLFSEFGGNLTRLLARMTIPDLGRSATWRARNGFSTPRA